MSCLGVAEDPRSWCSGVPRCARCDHHAFKLSQAKWEERSKTAFRGPERLRAHRELMRRVNEHDARVNSGEATKAVGRPPETEDERCLRVAGEIVLLVATADVGAVAAVIRRERKAAVRKKRRGP